MRPYKEEPLHRFDCVIKRRIFDAANAARTTTWPEIVEEAMLEVSLGHSPADVRLVSLKSYTMLNEIFKSGGLCDLERMQVLLREMRKVLGVK